MHGRANNFSCHPSAAHPYPVVVVHGTFGNTNDNWQAASPVLANHGYCVFAFNYGGAYPAADSQSTGDIAASARQPASFVTRVLAATGAPKVDIAGHSHGSTPSTRPARFTCPVARCCPLPARSAGSRPSDPFPDQGPVRRGSAGGAFLTTGWRERPGGAERAAPGPEPVRYPVTAGSASPARHAGVAQW